MNSDSDQSPSSVAARRYRWPWIVLLFVVLGILFAVLWVGLEVRRVQWQKKLSSPDQGGIITNSTR